MDQRARDWPLDAFDAITDAQSAKHRWADWLEQFEMVIESKEISTQREKFLLLMTRGGQQLHLIYKNQPQHADEVKELGFVRTVLPEYDNAIIRLNAYFNSKVNTRMEIEKFRDITQAVDEDFTKFVLRLRAQANRCEFGLRTEDEIMYQATRGASDEKVREKRIDVKLSLDQLMQFAIGREILTEQKREEKKVVNAWGPPKDEVAAVSEKWRRQAGRSGRIGRRDNYRSAGRGNRGGARRECSNCGSWYHSAGDFNCRAKNAECNNCKIVGHFEVKCRKPKMKQDKATVNNVDASWTEDIPTAESMMKASKVSMA